MKKFEQDGKVWWEFDDAEQREKFEDTVRDYSESQKVADLLVKSIFDAVSEKRALLRVSPKTPKLVSTCPNLFQGISWSGRLLCQEAEQWTCYDFRSKPQPTGELVSPCPNSYQAGISLIGGTG